MQNLLLMLALLLALVGCRPNEQSVKSLLDAGYVQSSQDERTFIRDADSVGYTRYALFPKSLRTPFIFAVPAESAARAVDAYLVRSSGGYDLHLILWVEGKKETQVYRPVK